MFSRSAELYDAFHAWKDYPAETETLDALIRRAVLAPRTLLDVACGTGKHLELLRDRYEVEGVELDPAMLAIARRRLPGVPLHEGDMTAFDPAHEVGLFAHADDVAALEAVGLDVRHDPEGLTGRGLYIGVRSA